MRSERENEEAGIGAWKEQQFRKGLLTRPSLDEEIQPAHMTGPEKKTRKECCHLHLHPSHLLPGPLEQSEKLKGRQGNPLIQPIRANHPGNGAGRRRKGSTEDT